MYTGNYLLSQEKQQLKPSVNERPTVFNVEYVSQPRGAVFLNNTTMSRINLYL
jgi:hypothetical protein